MDAGPINGNRGVTLNSSQKRTIQSTSPTAAKDALLSVQAELGVAIRTAKILADESPPISEEEAEETAERIVELLKASGDAFGSEAVIFQDLSPDRAKALLM